MEQGRDERFMRRALELARQAAAEGEVPVGAVVVGNDGREIGAGRNEPIGLADPTAHAEMQALRAAARTLGNYRLAGATLYSTVEPCLMCLGALLHARVGRLVYGADDPKVSATRRLADLLERGAETNHRPVVESGLLAEEASELLQEFFRDRRIEPAAVGT